MSQRHVNPLPFTTIEEACQLYNCILWLNGQITDADVDDADWEIFDRWMLNFEDKLQRLGGFDPIETQVETVSNDFTQLLHLIKTQPHNDKQPAEAS